MRIFSASDHASVTDRIHTVARRASDTPFLRLLSAESIPTELSYLDLLHQAAIWSEIYKKNGLQPRQRVIILVSHSIDSYAAFLGAMLSGLVPAMLPPPSPKLSKQRFSEIVNGLLPILRPDAIVVGAEMIGVTLQVSNVILIATQQAMTTRPLTNFVLTPSGSGGDPAFIQYSSGTTGLRKGVVISHASCLKQIEIYGDAIGLNADDSVVSWLPLYHDMGLVTSWLMPLLTGVPVTAMSPFDWVTRPSMLTTAIRSYRPSLCWLPNFAFSHLARSVPDAELHAGDLSSIRAFVNCSEPVRQSAHDAFLAKFAKAGARPDQIATCYAMAETTFAITASRPGVPPATLGVDPKTLGPSATVRPGALPLVSSGQPIPATVVRVVGEDGKDLPDRVVGHLRVVSPTLAEGYFANPDATRSAFRGGELRTGDIGFIDGGEVFVIGRADDTIIVAGRNLFPQDIEAVVDAVPGAIPGRSVAFGVDEAEAGTSHVVVVTESAIGAEEARADLARRITTEVIARLDISARVVRVVSRGWLVKSTSGKISRRLNRERYLAELASAPRPAQAGAAVAGEGPLVDFVRASVAEALGRPCPPDGESLIMGGHLDSLALTTLLLRLGDRFGERLPMPNTVGFHHFDSIEAMVRLLSKVESGFVAQSRQMTYAARDLKLNLLKESASALDLLIVGSSTSFPLPSKLAEARGLTAFNFSVNSATVADLYCLTRLAKDRRGSVGRLVIGLDVFAFKAKDGLVLDLRTVSFPELTRYLLPEDQSLIKQLGTNLTLAAQGHRAYLQRLAEWNPGFWYSFDNRNGDLVVGEVEEAATPSGSAADPKVHEMTMIFGEAFEQLDPRQVVYLEKLVDFARAEGCLVNFVIMPLHPRLHDVLASTTVYSARRAEVVKLVSRLSSATIHLHDYPTPATFGGDDEDFHDAYHMGLKNAEHLLRKILAR